MVKCDSWRSGKLSHSIEINHRYFKDTAAALLFAMQDVSWSPARRGRILVGASGVGKTRICEYLTSKFPRVKDGRRIVENGNDAVTDHIPVIYMTLDIEARKITLLEALADAIGTKTPHKRLQKHVIDSLYRCGTRWIILDEAQRLLKVGGKSYRPGLVETIKDIHDQAGTCFLLVGNPAAERALERDGQFRRRFDDTMYLPAYDWTNDIEAGEFCSVCQTLWESMSIPLDTALKENVVAFSERLHFVSTGIIGEVIKFFAKAEEIRRFDRIDVVDNNVLYKAANSAFALHKREYGNDAHPSRKDEANPFAPGWRPRKPAPYKPDWMG